MPTVPGAAAVAKEGLKEGVKAKKERTENDTGLEKQEGKQVQPGETNTDPKIVDALKELSKRLQAIESLVKSKVETAEKVEKGEGKEERKESDEIAFEANIETSMMSENAARETVSATATAAEMLVTGETSSEPKVDEAAASWLREQHEIALDKYAANIFGRKAKEENEAAAIMMEPEQKLSPRGFLPVPAPTRTTSSILDPSASLHDGVEHILARRRERLGLTGPGSQAAVPASPSSCALAAARSRALWEATTARKGGEAKTVAFPGARPMFYIKATSDRLTPQRLAQVVQDSHELGQPCLLPSEGSHRQPQAWQHRVPPLPVGVPSSLRVDLRRGNSVEKPKTQVRVKRSGSIVVTSSSGDAGGQLVMPPPLLGPLQSHSSWATIPSTQGGATTTVTTMASTTSQGRGHRYSEDGVPQLIRF